MLMALPVVGLLFFAVGEIQKSLATRSNSNDLMKLVELGTNASAVVHELQKERGATAGYIGSKGNSFVKILPEQRKDSDKKINILNDYLKGFDVTIATREFRESLNGALKQLKQL